MSIATDRGIAAESFSPFDWVHMGLPSLTDATCAEPGVDPSWWFPGTTKKDRIKAALAIRLCLHCPARAECLKFALEQDVTDGIWGGIDFEAQ